jgi:hypothetical protein
LPISENGDRVPRKCGFQELINIKLLIELSLWCLFPYNIVESKIPENLSISSYIDEYFCNSWQVLLSDTLRIFESPLDCYRLFMGRSRRATLTL